MWVCEAPGVESCLLQQTNRSFPNLCMGWQLYKHRRSYLRVLSEKVGLGGFTASRLSARDREDDGPRWCEWGGLKEDRRRVGSAVPAVLLYQSAPGGHRGCACRVALGRAEGPAPAPFSTGDTEVVSNGVNPYACPILSVQENLKRSL